jgi:hypothetical protein
MRTRTGAVTCIVALSALLTATSSSAARPSLITGKLSKPGYTVIALTGSGKAAAVRTGRSGGFRLRPPAGVVTLQLRNSDGVYAGPIVVGKSGRRAVTGVKAGAALGTVEVLDGYARLARSLRKRSLDAARWARTRRGVPIGAGNLGRVRSRGVRKGGPGDRDLDGVPNRLDVDDDGDLILDKLERRRVRAKASQGDGHPDPFDLAASLGGVPLEKTVNVNAGSSDDLINTVLPELGFLSMGVPQADSVELDCGGTQSPTPRPPLVGGLSYCSHGGTGRIDLDPPNNDRFPECCDGDGDGFGKLRLTNFGPDFAQFGLAHGATPAQIQAGDTLILRIENNGQESTLTDMHQFIFATTPAVKSFSDDAGNTTVISYPVSPGAPGSFGNGGSSNGFPVSDGPDSDSDVELGVTLWRPQRRPTSAQECVQPPAPDCVQREWIDIGGLEYTAASRAGQQKTSDSGWCDQDSFTSADSMLSAGFGDPQGGGFRDLAADGPANAANTFTYTLNLSKCLRRYDLTFNRGETQAFDFQAFTPITGGGTAGSDNSSSLIVFTRQ